MPFDANTLLTSVWRRALCASWFRPVGGQRPPLNTYRCLPELPRQVTLFASLLSDDSFIP
jgi:hypothetical protein